MKDMVEHLANLREQIAKCEQLRDSATSNIKRATFDRVVAHYRVLAGELERSIAEMEAKGAHE